MFEAEPGNMFARLGDLLQYLLQRYTVWEILRLFSVKPSYPNSCCQIDNLIIDEIKIKNKTKLKKGKKGYLYISYFRHAMDAVCD